MVDVAQVNIFGQPMGTLMWNEARGIAQFQYADSFIGAGLEPSPLIMPVIAGQVYSFPELSENTYNHLPGLLADSLPDTYGKALFEKWMTLTGHTSANVVETLCYLGKRCMGALEFEPAKDISEKTSGKFEIDSLVEVASEALAEKANFGTNLAANKKAAIAEILRLGTSAGGQRAKAIIAYNKNSGDVRSGQVPAPEGFDYYIIKLDGVTAEAGFKETQNFGRLEYSFYRLALECGIEMTYSDLIEENGRAHFLTKRFDRVNHSKIHMQTLCAMAHYDYQLRRAYSYEQAFNVMRMLHLPYSQIDEMFRRMVFNVVVRNQDDHTKNISFLMGPDGEWRLSPAYDMTYSYKPDGSWTAKHQMSINGKFDDITRADLIECGKRNNIKNAAEIIDQVCEAASHWPQIAAQSEVPKTMITEIISEMKLSL